MAININVQYNGGLLPDIILLTQCYYHRGTRLNAMKRFWQPMIPSKRFDIFSVTGGCSKGLGAFRFFFKNLYFRKSWDFLWVFFFVLSCCILFWVSL